MLCSVISFCTTRFLSIVLIVADNDSTMFTFIIKVTHVLPPSCMNFRYRFPDIYNIGEVVADFEIWAKNRSTSLDIEAIPVYVDV